MATTPKTSALQVSQVDFDGIKAAFKSFLRDQDEFTSYDFEGSGMSVLMDLLAYNTHYNAIYANMIASEMFLDSAVIRENIVSRAKQLGYIPTSTRGSTVELNVIITDVDAGAQGVSSITIPRYTKFSSKLEDKVYTFLTTKATVASLTDPYTSRSTYVAENVEVKEGQNFYETFVSEGNAAERFTITSSSIDTSTVSVVVNGTKYDEKQDYTTLTSTSNVYFMQESSAGNYEMYFGDGVLGRKLNNGDVVSLNYIDSMLGPFGNGARVFKLAETLASPAGGSVDSTAISLSSSDVDYASSGGALRESINSMKLLAPLNYESQNRAVTTDDYRARILNDVVGVESVNVWGGENNSPPEYGKVFISLKPASGYTISASQKEDIKASIQNYNVASILPTIVDPGYLYPVLTVQAMYDPGETTASEAALALGIKNKIAEYSSTELNKFNNYFRHSKVSRAVDDVDSSITNSLIDVKLRYAFTPTLNTNLDYLVSFSNPLYHPHSGHMSILSSTLFSVIYGDEIHLDCTFDDVDGVVRIVQTTVDGGKIVIKESGTIDYETGLVNIEDFIPLAINDGSTQISLTATPRSYDIIPSFNQIVSIDGNDVTVNMVDETQLTSTNRSKAGGSVTISRGTYSTTDTGTGSGASGAGGPSGGY